MSVESPTIRQAGGPDRRSLQPVDLLPLPARPLFSILIPNYNYGRYIAATLESVLNQTYPHFEAIVSDDGSTDNSREIVLRYATKDPRVRLLAKENAGFCTAVNRAYSDSKGELIALLDADDLFRPTKLEMVLEAFNGNPRSGLCVHPHLPVSEEGRPLGPPFPSNLDNGWLAPLASRRGGWTSLPPTSSLCFRREIAALLFPIPVEVKRLIDYYISRTAQFFTEVSLIPEWLTQYRIHGTNMSGLSASDSYVGLLGLNARANERFIQDIEEVLPVQKDFLRRFYGEEIAERLRLEDHICYWDSLLATRAIRGKRAGAIRPYTLNELISHIPVQRSRRIWRLICLLPRPLSVTVLRFWRTPSRLKTLIKIAVFGPRHQV
jgi:glycosyltransferase involved in cell wall biosynthesis